MLKQKTSLWFPTAWSLSLLSILSFHSHSHLSLTSCNAFLSPTTTQSIPYLHNKSIQTHVGLEEQVKVSFHYRLTHSFPTNTIKGFRSSSSSSSKLLSSSSSTLSSLSQLISAFSKSASSSTNTLEHIIQSTPPLIYFLALLAAGFGLPISEDALCILAGTNILSLFETSPHQAKLMVLALYAGVVISDIITFTLGRVMKFSILEPFKNKLNLSSEKVTFCEDEDENNNNDNSAIEKEENAISDDEALTPCIIETPKLRKQQSILERVEKTGDYVGFIIRFSVGMRAPMMLLSGFTGKVSYLNFIIGSSIGGACSLSLQLIIGYLMRNNIGAVFGFVASLSTIMFIPPLVIAILSSSVFIKRKLGFS